MAARSLTIAGVLIDGRTLRLDPSFVVDEAPTPLAEGGPEAPGVVLIESLDSAGETLEATPVESTPLCLFQSGLPTPRLVAAVVAVEDRARGLRFHYQGYRVHEVHFPSVGPKVQLRWTNGDSEAVSGGGLRMLEWSTSHPENADVASLPMYFSEGRGWQPLGLPSPATAVPVDFDDLPGGAACRLRVLATDGAHTVAAESEPFPVRTKGFQTVILAPDDGANLTAEIPVALAGQAFHWEDPGMTTEDLEWTSTLDGTLGTGPLLDVSLSPGDHVISLRVVGDEGRPASVVVSVGPDPCRRPPREPQD
jgi:hypothetical protein